MEQLRAKLAELAHPTTPVIVVVDQRGFIVHLDAALAAVLGWDPSDLVGRPLTKMIPPRFRDAHHLGFSRFVATRRPTLLERRLVAFTILHRDGRELPAEHVIVALETPHGLLFAAAIQVESS